jgi:hypothetical protein
MQETVKIEGGFAEVGAGAWLMSRGQPTAFFGSTVRRRRKGFFLRDRSALDLVETTSAARCADARRPFLTHIACAAPISAVSFKVLVAPAAARTGAEAVKVIPMSARGSLCITQFGEEWVVLATASRTARLQVEDGDTLSVRPESVVAWTGNRPTGFCPKLGLWDVLLPRGPRDLLLHFHGPSVVWVEGSNAPNHLNRKLPNFYRRHYGA